MALHFIIHRYAIQIYIGQKARENQWRVVEFLHTALLYQVTSTRKTSIDCTETIQSLLKKNNGMTSVQFVIVST